MIYKPLIEQLYINKDNQRKIKAYTLGGSSSIFNYSFPVSLTKYAIDNASQIKKFQLVFYTGSKFDEEFSSRNDVFESRQNNLNKFHSAVDNDIFISDFSKNMSINYYYNNNIEHDGIYEVDFILNDRYYNQRLRYYEIILNINDSRDIFNNNYTALKIFLLDQNNSIIDEIDFSYFGESFFQIVYEEERVEDDIINVINLFFDEIENNLNLVLIPDTAWMIQFLIPETIYTTRHEDNSYVFTNISGSITYNESTSRTSSLDGSRFSGSRLSPITPYTDGSEPGLVVPEFFDFFKDIFYNYHQGQNQFNIKLNLQVSLRPDVTSDVLINQSFEKNLVLNRNSDFIRAITSSAAEASIVSRGLAQIDFNINTEIFPTFIKISVSKDENDRCFEFVKIKSADLFVNVQSEFYLNRNLDKNSEINLVGKKLSTLFGENNSFTLYSPNNINFLIIRPSFNLAYLNDSPDSPTRRVIQTPNPIFNKTDYKSNFNVFNETLTRYIQLENVVNQRISLDTNASRYNTLYISDINSLQNSAFSFGYIANAENSQNIINGIYEFLNNCVYKINFKEKISDGRVVKQDYFYGNEIFDITLQDGRDIVYVKEEFLTSFLSNTVRDLSKKIKSSKRSSLNNFISNISSDMSIRQIIGIIKDYEDVIKDLKITKTIEIKAIPILKNISISKSRGTDVDNNIIFDSNDTSDEEFVKLLSLSFVNLFYDSNSSLSYQRFLAYKKAYFYNSETTSNSISLGQGLDLNRLTLLQKEKASSLRPIWDYLFSGLYLNANRKFSNTETLRVEEFFDTAILEEINYVDINNFIVRTPMLGFENKYYDFTINNLNNIFIKSTNLAINFSNFYNQDRKRPQNIKIFSEINFRDFYVEIDITNLKLFFDEQTIINQSRFLVKSSIHPLVLNDKDVEDNDIVKNVDFLGSRSLKFLTQSKNFMKPLNFQEGFINFNKGAHHNKCRILSQGQSIILRVNLTNLYNKSFYSYKDFFDQCISNDLTMLKDFYVRIALNINIENMNLFFCMHKKIDRANLVNTDIFIDNLLSIESLHAQN